MNKRFWDSSHVYIQDYRKLWRRINTQLIHCVLVRSPLYLSKFLQTYLIEFYVYIVIEKIDLPCSWPFISLGSVLSRAYSLKAGEIKYYTSNSNCPTKRPYFYHVMGCFFRVFRLENELQKISHVAMTTTNLINWHKQFKHGGSWIDEVCREKWFIKR